MANIRMDSTQDYACLGRDSSGTSVAVDAEDKDKPKVNVGEKISKRGRSPSASPGRPHKSPRMQSESTTQMDGAPEACMEGTAAPIELPVKIHGAPETSCSELGSVNTQGENLEGSAPIETPCARRKSLRRSTIGRRSLPAFQNPIQSLCRSISPSLPQEERLEQLMKAAMEGRSVDSSETRLPVTSSMLAIESTRDSLKSTPGASMETFQKQVEDMKKEWCCLAKNIHNETQYQQIPSSTASDPVVEQTMEQTRQAIKRLQLESESWEGLLNKHRSKAEALTRKVQKGQESGVELDSASVVRSSQYQFIQSKPDYRDILRQQLPRLQSMELVMDTQRKIAQELLSIHDRAQLLVTETSMRLRLEAEAGFQNQPCDNIRHLLMATKDPPLIDK